MPVVVPPQGVNVEQVADAVWNVDIPPNTNFPSTWTASRHLRAQTVLLREIRDELRLLRQQRETGSAT